MDTCYDSIGKWVSLLHRQFQKYMNHHFKPLGINSSEFFLYIITLYDNDEALCQNDLSKKILLLDKAAVARSIKSLEKKEFITRIQDPNNYKVKKRVYLTDKANQLSSTLIDILDEWDKRLKKISHKRSIQSAHRWIIRNVNWRYGTKSQRLRNIHLKNFFCTVS